MIYYVFNESGGVKRILEGSWANWPAYFTEKFRLRWNDWLVDLYTDEAYLANAMRPLSTSHYWTAVHTQDDPVMVSSLAAARQMFLHGKLDKAEDPVVVEVGEDALFGYDRHNGVNLSQQTFTRGSLIRYRPDEPGGVTVDGEPLADPPASAGRWRWAAGLSGIGPTAA